MRKANVFIVAAVVCLLAQAVAQTTSENRNPFATWSIHPPDVPLGKRTVYLVGVLTPIKPIVIHRIEALSSRGPVDISRGQTVEPIPCPLRYALEITNGMMTQSVPISNVFISKGSSQTYTDSGRLNLSFRAEDRISLSLILPQQPFPPVNCALNGLNITVQYELAENASDQQTSQVAPR
jgi:hypothetical protein